MTWIFSPIVSLSLSFMINMLFKSYIQIVVWHFKGLLCVLSDIRLFWRVCDTGSELVSVCLSVWLSVCQIVYVCLKYREKNAGNLAFTGAGARTIHADICFYKQFAVPLIKNKAHTDNFSAIAKA